MTPPIEDSYDKHYENCKCKLSDHPGLCIDYECLGAVTDYVWSSHDPTSKDARCSRLARTRERRTLSWEHHQSEKLRSLEFKFRFYMFQPPLVIKGTPTDIWREDRVKASLVMKPRQCHCDRCLAVEGPIRRRDRDLLWGTRRAEKGKDWKGRTVGGNSRHGQKLPNWVDYDWNVESDDVDVDVSWDEVENACEEEARVMDVELLDLITKSYPRRRRMFSVHSMIGAPSLTSLTYRTAQGEEANFCEFAGHGFQWYHRKHPKRLFKPMRRSGLGTHDPSVGVGPMQCAKPLRVIDCFKYLGKM